jgi:hypothetical protein
LCHGVVPFCILGFESLLTSCSRRTQPL